MKDNTLKRIASSCLVLGMPILLATLFCGVFWVRSYFTYDSMARWHYRMIDDAWVVDHLHLNSGKGGVNLVSARETPTNEKQRKHVQEHAGIDSYWQTNSKTQYPTRRILKGRWGKLGFYRGPVLPNSSASGNRTGSELLMPWWCPTLLLALLSGALAVPFIGYIRKRKRANQSVEVVALEARRLEKKMLTRKC